WTFSWISAGNGGEVFLSSATGRLVLGARRTGRWGPPRANDGWSEYTSNRFCLFCGECGCGVYLQRELDKPGQTWAVTAGSDIMGIGYGVRVSDPFPGTRPLSPVPVDPQWGQEVHFYLGLKMWTGLGVAALAAYPTIALIRGPLRRWHRRRKGLCLKCGYDLTGNVTGVCPECGRELVKP
ncbi:MAG: hypothetical protein ACYTFA_15685, partial [Planctomycetota bacterium]